LDGGNLFNRVRGKALPAWAADFDCTTWSQFFLKFVVSHPAVTCAIPATSQIAHMFENMGAAVGRLPDLPTRARMATQYSAL
ncbi:MAG: aldo/keto reductase, partial [Gemmatimonadaceae bacterium]